LTKHRDKLDRLAEALEAREELDEQAIEELIGPPAYRSEAAGKALGAARGAETNE